jgi:hypothetical protein
MPVTLAWPPSNPALLRTLGLRRGNPWDVPCSKDFSRFLRQQQSPITTAASIATPTTTEATAVAMTAPPLNFCFCPSLSGEFVGMVVIVWVTIVPLIVTTCIDVIPLGLEPAEVISPC